MTEFDTAYASSFAAMLIIHGETVTYTVDGGAGASITAIWRPREVEPMHHSDGEQQRLFGEIECSLTDVSAGTDRDTFAIGGVTYAVERITSRTPTWVADLVSYVDRTVGSDKIAHGGG